MHEYTPAGQEDLKAWTDMLTILFYQDIKGPEGLAGSANVVLNLYKQNGAQIIGTTSMPKTDDAPAEHLIIAAFSMDEHAEAVFAKFKLVGDTSAAAILSHRISGNKEETIKEMQVWLDTNIPLYTKALLEAYTVPGIEEE